MSKHNLQTDVPSLFTPGTYTATAQGMGEVTGTMTFDAASSVTDVQLDLAGETESIGQAAGEYAVLNGTLNKRWGREGIVDTDTVVDRLMRECTYRNKRPTMKKWAEHAHEVMDWFIDAYPDITICDATRELVAQEQFDKGILVPLAWPHPALWDT